MCSSVLFSLLPYNLACCMKEEYSTERIFLWTLLIIFSCTFKMTHSTCPLFGELGDPLNEMGSEHRQSPISRWLQHLRLDSQNLFLRCTWASNSICFNYICWMQEPCSNAHASVLQCEASKQCFQLQVEYQLLVLPPLSNWLRFDPNISGTFGEKMPFHNTTLNT